MRRSTRALAAGCAALWCVASAAGCATARRVGVNQASPLFTTSMRAYETETDLAVARAAAPALMKLI